MFGKLFVLVVAAGALAACENQGGAVMTPPLSKTGTANNEQAPVSYMVFFNLGSTKLAANPLLKEKNRTRRAELYQQRDHG